MERTTFLKNYRIRLQYDGSPYEPATAGSITSYEAVDQRTAEPVSVTLIPTGSINSSERQQFEEDAFAAQKLRHANIAKVLDFGRDDDDYVYVSERLAGETLASWVCSHGSMPADAALRVGEQIVSVLSSAGFHKLPVPPDSALGHRAGARANSRRHLAVGQSDQLRLAAAKGSARASIS